MEHIKGVSATVAGVSGATVSWLEVANTIVSITSGILAAIASAFAIYYYIKKARHK